VDWRGLRTGAIIELALNWSAAAACRDRWSSSASAAPRGADFRRAFWKTVPGCGMGETLKGCAAWQPVKLVRFFLRPGAQILTRRMAASSPSVECCLLIDEAHRHDRGGQIAAAQACASCRNARMVRRWRQGKPLAARR